MDKSQERLREALKYLGPKKPVKEALQAMLILVWEMMKTQTKLNKIEEEMDKKMHKITESMKSAVKDIDKDKPKAAEKVLKGAEKKNEKLVKIDKEVRDPMIEKCKKEMPMKKGKK
jgi:hypothetical protein